MLRRFRRRFRHTEPTGIRAGKEVLASADTCARGSLAVLSSSVFLHGHYRPFRKRAVEGHNHLGDCSSLRGGLFEMRLAGRIGLRIYFANNDGAIVLLLGGSGKSNQQRAIKRVRDRLKDFREWNDE